MKEHELNLFGHVSSLAENTRNKSARLFCLSMGTRPLLRVFHFSNIQLEDLLLKIFKEILADLFVITKKGH